VNRWRAALRVAVAAAVLAPTLAACSLPGLVTGPVELTATFDDVGDLVTGHSVQVADVRVGSITGIELTDGFRARVTMSVKDDLDLPIDSLAVLRTTSLLGEKFIELRPPTEGEGSEPAEHCDADVLVDGCQIVATQQAPELEFVAEEAVQVLGGVVANDLGTLVETGAVGFGGRAAELGSLIDSIATVSATMADQSGNIVRIIDGLDEATATLAANDDDIDQLLVNLARTTEVLSDNRDLTLQTLESLTRLARDQNEIVLQPFRDDLERQLGQLDALLATVVGQREEVGVLVDWLARFVEATPRGIPDDFAQVYGWFVLAPLEEEGG
jgi:phospholipid/cholesterol/gamma-HCH transport system substrate-binding protein